MHCREEECLDLWSAYTDESVRNRSCVYDYNSSLPEVFFSPSPVKFAFGFIREYSLHPKEYYVVLFCVLGKVEIEGFLFLIMGHFGWVKLQKKVSHLR